MTVDNSAAVAGLEPVPLWSFFADISAIPRPSKGEQQLLAWLKSFAEERHLEWKQDDMGNLVIIRPGSGGGEEAPWVVVQGHIDMVTEKNADKEHDFWKDGIKFVRNEGDEWLGADGTTLGADNGIGVATALALLDSGIEVKLPPLECLFTVDEETGLTGAYGISGDLVKGKTMLNLDTEEWTEICIGCAGGGDSMIELDVAKEASPKSTVAFKIVVDGLMGGHSGINIHEDRGNAVQLMARAVRAMLSSLGPHAKLVEVKGGDKRNAIAREASAIILVPAGEEAAAQKVLDAKFREFKSEYGAFEKGLNMVMSGVQEGLHPMCMVASDTSRLLSLLEALPHGALKKSHAIEGLVETSNNVASVQPLADTDTTYLVVTSTRSSIGSALEAVRDRIGTIASLCGARVGRGPAYPGWQPNPDSALLQVTKKVYKKYLGKDATVGALHAGLECGILGEKFPGMDMVSFGPTIREAHSPDERVLISTVKPFWELTLGILVELADRR